MAGTLTERVVAAKPGWAPVEVTRSLDVGQSRAFGPHYVQGYTSSLAADSLRSLGLHRATDVIGGFEAWAAEGLPSVPKP